MNIEITTINGKAISEIISDRVVIHTAQDALNIMADSAYQGASRIIMHEKDINPDFFDLKTRLAGDILQKFSNYRARLAIVGDFSKYSSKSLKDFIFESNKQGQINFVNTIEEAKERLSR
ncbi:MAG: DUF4180 domain-containing protein [Bacteroidia bacterium]|nr:DUF4180 domain-containing protein [Bacteroidia bacterium]